MTHGTHATVDWTEDDIATRDRLANEHLPDACKDKVIAEALEELWKRKPTRDEDRRKPLEIVVVGTPDRALDGLVRRRPIS